MTARVSNKGNLNSFLKHRSGGQSAVVTAKIIFFAGSERPQKAQHDFLCVDADPRLMSGSRTGGDVDAARAAHWQTLAAGAPQARE